MRPVNFLVPDLGYASHAKQVSLLAPAIQAAGHPVRVLSLAGPGPFAAALHDAGIVVAGRRGRRLLDIDDVLALRRLVRATGDGILHVFGRSTLRSLLAGTLGMPLPRIVLSLTGREALGRLDRWLIKTVSKVLVPHQAAADALTRTGVRAGQIALVPLAVAEAPPLDRGEFCRAHGWPADVPLCAAAGGMNRRDDLYEAIWSFEFVRHPEPTVRLMLLGDGPARAETYEWSLAFARGEAHVHFLGGRADVPAVLGVADLVLVPQPAGGANVALEAMAAGRPVVAGATPDLQAIIRDGVTGILVPPHSIYPMARAVRNLLYDPPRRSRLGDGARAAARAQHSVPGVLGLLKSIYNE
jgi:glycosyltransferase involved in cell wall biosynthesis